MKVSIALKFRSSNDQRLSNLMDCEPLRSIVACDSQMIAVRESQFQFPFRGTIARFDRLLEQTQHWYCIERVALSPDDLPSGARRINDPASAGKSTTAPINLEVVHAEGNLANLLPF